MPVQSYPETAVSGRPLYPAESLRDESPLGTANPLLTDLIHMAIQR